MSDHNNRTGVEPKYCTFFDEFSEIFCTKASTRPEATREVGAATATTTSTEPCVKKVKVDRNSSINKVLETIEKHADKQIGIMQKMHQDKMARMDRLLDLLAKK